MSNKRNNNYPKKQKNHNKQNKSNERKPNGSNNVKKYRNSTSSIFKGNDMFHNKSFDNKGQELSGYVERTLIQIDQYGNKQIAKEKQFINSGRNMNIKINNERKKKY